MKLGFGLYYHLLDDEHLAFAKQCGATHLIIHLVDYFNQGPNNASDNQPIGDDEGWGIAGSNPHVWELDYLRNLKTKIESHGLIWYGVENFDPCDWYDILLGGPRREEQLHKLIKIIVNLGALGIKAMGYNFSLAGVSSRIIGPFARGGAESVGMDGIPAEKKIPLGMIWNMVYDMDLYQRAKKEGVYHKQISHEEFWARHEWFIKALAPVAEKAGIMLAAHPDDPPLEWVRGQPRLVYKAELYQKLIDSCTCVSNGLELCLGTLQEMPGEVYEFLESYVAQKRIAYIHLRNIRGKAPNYKEVFIDEGDLDVVRVMQILRKWNFDGLIIPDHAPKMTCPGGWHAGMAFAMGYLKATMVTV